MTDADIRRSIRNAVLAQLTPEEWRRLSGYAELVPLSKGQLLCDDGDTPRYGYFPVSGLLSVLATTEEGAAIEVAMIGREGFAGVPIVLRRPATSQIVVELPGDGYRVRADILLQEFRRDGAFQIAALQQIDRLLSEGAQAVLCHRYHSVCQRFCRWLLTVRAWVRAETIEVTQEHIAEMLAIPRSAVSTTAANLQDRDCIRQRHGRIQILKPRELEIRTCECYRLWQHGAPDAMPIDRREGASTRTVRRVDGSGVRVHG